MGPDPYMQVQTSRSDLQHLHSPTSTMPGPVPPLGTQDAYHSPTGPPPPPNSMNYIDDNPRPSKSPRHMPPPDAQFPDISSRYATAHVPQNEAMPPREYFSANLPSHPLPPRPDAEVYGTAMPSNYQGQGYEYAQGGYARDSRPSPSGQQNYTWSAP